MGSCREDGPEDSISFLSSWPNSPPLSATGFLLGGIGVTTPPSFKPSSATETGRDVDSGEGGTSGDRRGDGITLLPTVFLCKNQGMTGDSCEGDGVEVATAVTSRGLMGGPEDV